MVRLFVQDFNTVYEYTRVSDTSFHADRIISLKLDAVEWRREGGGRGREKKEEEKGQD